MTFALLVLLITSLLDGLYRGLLLLLVMSFDVDFFRLFACSCACFFFLLCSRGLVLAMLFLAVHLVQLNSCLLFGVALDFGDVCVCLFVRLFVCSCMCVGCVVCSCRHRFCVFGFVLFFGSLLHCGDNHVLLDEELGSAALRLWSLGAFLL